LNFTATPFERLPDRYLLVERWDPKSTVQDFVTEKPFANSTIDGLGRSLLWALSQYAISRSKVHNCSEREKLRERLILTWVSM